MNTYFVTGASGAVGSAIVPLLLAMPDTQVRILLRAESAQHLEQRMEALFTFWGIEQTSKDRQRIEPFLGDATLPDFGLSRTRYAQLCADTKPLEDARRSAIGSTNEILAMARQLKRSGTLRKVEFVSTVGVGGKRPGILPETWIDEEREFHNTYEQSKAEAETLVRAAIENEQLPITVHRPSMVIGNSTDGRIIHFQIFYFICEFLSGRRTFGLYPDFGDARLDVIPVDWVANAIVTASTDPATAGRIIHLCTGPDASPRLTELRTMVRAAFRSHHLPTPSAITLPRMIFGLLPRIVSPFIRKDRRKALMTLPIYLDYLSESQGFASNENIVRTTAAHTPSKITLPLDIAIRYYLADLFTLTPNK